ncbi:hypothetical protein EW146_g4480 [Bondarzewia mesenterica]|uniref:Guanine nucleotide-binding protein subunit alpha n=1 Tax=Bondarzewia mesenterica TaxID=1095465 RepID=A0A4S4LUF3_9AGAM|nr:hypothetical protein EW146_g4480 [Bondarzewia mesenterica]
MIRTHRPSSLYSQDDPLAFVLRPPETETEGDKRARLQAEANAKNISDAIDEELKLEKRKYDKYRQDVKLLLLGQAESGKSTLQKQFQLMYAPESLDKERLSWRIVIYFNVARSVKRLLDVLEAYEDNPDDESTMAEGAENTSNSDHEFSRPGGSGILLGGRDGSPSLGSSPHESSMLSPESGPTSKSHDQAKFIATLRLRLSPLVSAERALAERLSGGVQVVGSGKGSVFVRRGWQSSAFGTKLGKSRRSLSSVGSGRPNSRTDSRAGTRASVDDSASASLVVIDEVVEEVARILEVCQEDIKSLWECEAVQKLIQQRRLRLEEWTEFFLSDIVRISARGYEPTIDDILHARIQTMGVAEHTFEVPLHGKSVTWHLFDVGGARGQRHSWIPYFDDANAIIFVAPVSAFDQYLEEDPRTNRIDDSLQLFTQICSNPLLKNVHMVLFLNKTDVLKAKLESGRYSLLPDSITSYGDRPNEYEAVLQYFRSHFLQVHRRNNEQKRVLYTHFTSVVDTKTTRSIIANVRDSIFRGYLKSAALV